MQADQKYREYLLGLADEETEAEVEEAILNGRVDAEYLRLIEAELMDEIAGGRLSPREEQAAQSDFLCNPHRLSQLEFSRALHRYATDHAPEPDRLTLLAKLRAWTSSSWTLSLAGALACCVLGVTWMATRPRTPDQSTAGVSQPGNHRKEVPAAARSTGSSGKADAPLVAANASPPQYPGLPVNASPPVTAEAGSSASLELFPGVSRGIAIVPTLHLGKGADNALFMLALPPGAKNIRREALLNAGDKELWSWQASGALRLSDGVRATVSLPSSLFTDGDYRLRLEFEPGGGSPGSIATYLFRVRKD